MAGLDFQLRRGDHSVFFQASFRRGGKRRCRAPWLREGLIGLAFLWMSGTGVEGKKRTCPKNPRGSAALPLGLPAAEM